MSGLSAARTIVLLATAPLASFASQEGTSPPAPTWHALFVACTEYPELARQKPDVYEAEIRLVGPTHDVELLRDRLEKVVVSEWASVTTLAGGAEDARLRPTLRNIKRELRDLAQRDLEGARVLLYFAGHGARQIDRNGDEIDGLDEVFLAEDAGVAKSGRIPGALTDDEIARAVTRIRRKGASIWIVMDCCHASTGMRGGNVRQRGLSDELLGVTQAGRKSTRRDRPDALGADLDGIVAYYASESDAPTPELDLDEGDGTVRRHGLFTWALARELERSEPGETFAALFARVEERCIAQRAAGGTVPIAEGDMSLTLGGAARGPSALGWLQSDADLAESGLLRVSAEGEVPELEALHAAAGARLARWSTVGADAHVDGTGERWLLRVAGVSDVLLERSGSLGQRLGAARLLRIARALEAEQRGPHGPLFEIEMQVRSKGSGSFAPVGDTTRLTPGDGLSLSVTATRGGAFDLYAFWIDGAFQTTPLFPLGRSTPRVSLGAGDAIQLLSRRQSVVGSGLGAERIVVLAFARGPGDPVISLGPVDLGEVARGADSHAVRPWAGILSFSTGYRPIEFRWPARTPEDATMAEFNGTFRGDIVIVRRTPSEEPHELRVDLDGTGQRVGDPSAADDARFDLVLRVEGQSLSALYDTDGDGKLDLELTDADRDGTADSFRERGAAGWGRNRPLQLPLLDAGHFGVRPASFDSSRVQRVLLALRP